jgi:predicted kinase
MKPRIRFDSRTTGDKFYCVIVGENRTDIYGPLWGQDASRRIKELAEEMMEHTRGFIYDAFTCKADSMKQLRNLYEC